MTNFRVLVDGVEIDPMAAGTYECDTFDMFQTSDMFMPGDTSGTIWSPKGPKVMTCHKHWQWTPQEQLRLAQYIDIEETAPAIAIRNAFFGMLCLGWGTRGYDAVDYAIREPRWE